MKFHSRKLIKPGDLNANNTLFGGALLKWIDEEAGIYAMTKLDTNKLVTKYISEIDFVNSSKQGDVIEIGLEFKSIGTTSITLSCIVRNLFTKKTIISIDKIVFVKIDELENAVAHGKSIDNLDLHQMHFRNLTMKMNHLFFTMCMIFSILGDSFASDT